VAGRGALPETGTGHAALQHRRSIRDRSARTTALRALEQGADLRQALVDACDQRRTPFEGHELERRLQRPQATALEPDQIEGDLTVGDSYW
jgi:hypothetical protein